MEKEEYFQCPYCWSNISILIDMLSGSQKYIEDCEVCCKPIEISFITTDGKIESLEVKRLDE